MNLIGNKAAKCIRKNTTAPTTPSEHKELEPFIKELSTSEYGLDNKMESKKQTLKTEQNIASEFESKCPNCIRLRTEIDYLRSQLLECETLMDRKSVEKINFV